MARYTVSTARAEIAELRSGQAEILKGLEALTAAVLGPQQPAKPAKAPKAPAKAASGGKVYRSKPGKEAAKAQVAALYEADRQKYGVKRWSAIPAKAQAKTRAQCDAIWAAVPKTRTTKG